MTSFLNRLPEAPTYSVGGDLVHILADGAATNGVATVVHVVCPPGSGPPPHTHANEDELFFVLEGEMTFLLGGREVTGGPGTFVYGRRGERHRFCNLTDAPARFLVTITPSGIETFFREAGSALPAGTMRPVAPTKQEIESMIAACPRYGITLHL